MSSYHINIPNWIEENKKDFLPPVCNKMMHSAGHLKVFYVGGPNIRKDFHLEEGEEFFYMVKGDMNLIVLENNRFKDVQIKEGEVFQLPAKIPHSPQRYDNTVGLVIERERLKEETDCLRYFIEGSTETLFEKWFYCEDLGVQLGPVIKEFFASEQCKTGKPVAGTITSNPPWVPNATRKVEAPFSLNDWIKKHREEIQQKGGKKLFGDSYESEIIVYGGGDDDFEDETEHWIWQIEGESDIKIEGVCTHMKTQDSFLIKSKTAYKHTRPATSVSLRLKMNPKNKK